MDIPLFSGRSIWTLTRNRPWRCGPRRGGDRAVLASRHARDEPGPAAPATQWQAAILAAGIGAFAMGVFVIANEAGLYTAPALDPPSGGVSGRTTYATRTWLIAWFMLHRRWSARRMAAPRVFAITLVLIAIGIVLTFPPVWRLVG